MIPLRDENPTTHPPYATLVLIALNVLAFLAWQPTFGTDQEQQLFFFCHAEIPWEVTNQENLADGGAEAREAIVEDLQATEGQAAELQQTLERSCGEKSWWQSLFVAMFLHGGWLHIAGNMLFLWVFGNNVEDKLRPLPYVLFYVGGGLAATGAQLVIDVDSVIPSLGASGAIAAVLGAYLLMFPRRRVLTLIMFFLITTVYLPAFVVLGLWFVLQLFSGVGQLTEGINAGGGVAFWAHIGGFVFGALMAILFFPKERFGDQPPPRRPDFGGGWGGGRRWGRRRGSVPPRPDPW